MDRGQQQRDRRYRDDPRTARYESVRDHRSVHDHRQNGASIGHLFRNLSREAQILVREQIRLATMEVRDIGSDIGKNASQAGAGGFVAYAGFLSLVGGAALLLGRVVPLWLSFMLVGVLVLIVGYALFRSGTKGLAQTDYSLNRTAQTLQEDKQWMKHEADEVKNDPSHLGSDH